MEFDFSDKIKKLFSSSSSASLEEDIQSLIDSKKQISIFSEDESEFYLSDKISSILEEKVALQNEKHDKKTTVDQLKKVYRRGSGSFSFSHRIGKTRAQWAIARVNMFLKMERGEEVKDSYKKVDQDIAEGHDLYYIERDGEAFWDFDDIELGLAKLDLITANIDAKFQNQEAEELEFSEIEKKTLNKPFKFLSESSKKFGVYVKNDKGNIIMVKFGDANKESGQKDISNIDPKYKPKYWSHKFWEPKPVVSMASAEELLLSDEDGLEWDWNDSSFEDEDIIYFQNPDLKNIKDSIEEDLM